VTNFELIYVKLEGVVIKSTGSWYSVRDESGNITECRMRGKFRIQGIQTTNPVAVGDVVDFKLEEDGRAVINNIQERKNYIIRRSTNLSKQYHILASNIDQLYLIVTIAQPRTSNGFIDRFLVTAESFRIPVVLLFNKKDLYNEKQLEQVHSWIYTYESIGYRSRLVSAHDQNDLKSLREQMKGKVTLFCGHSGSGKSSMINGIQPGLDLKTGDISSAHSKGMHTTTFAEMFDLEEGGYIIDTPGIKELGLAEVGKPELSHFFPEMRKLLNQCRFNNCIHVNEPGCKVKEGVEDGSISEMRYESYLNMLASEDLK
jgi:ribosome biogenesis GTPase / thiamine phosphate phosphatase